jgi:DNA-binding PadR family transcriptional regulator
MAETNKQAKQHGPSSPTRAVLAAVVEHPSHGWEIRKRLNARMAPTWEFTQRRVYEALTNLEADGLVMSEVVRDAAAPNGAKRVFHATTRGVQVCAAWMKEGDLAQPTHGDTYAWMLLSRPEEAPAILARLAEEEVYCMEKVEASTQPMGRSVAWRDRMLSQHRAAIRERYLCELRCISRARQDIEEYLAE